METAILFLVSFLLGFGIFTFFNDPVKSSAKKNRLPKIKYKNIEIFPYFRIHIRQKTYHLHHWATLTLITGVGFFFTEGLQHFLFLKALAIGGIFQGLRYPSRFKFRLPRITDDKRTD